MIVSKFSAGLSSFLATWLIRDVIDVCLYTHIEDHHPDNTRFIRDAERLLGLSITTIQSPYLSVENSCRKNSYIRGVGGARCTKDLKRIIGDKWMYENDDDDMTFVWGIDASEELRADRLANISLPNVNHRFPLIENNLTKKHVHEICIEMGLKRPAMYDLGYENNNCVGCVKGGMGYWNAIREDFPEVFNNRAKMERDIGSSIIKGVWLDELTRSRGRRPKKIEIEECGLFCQAIMEDA